MPKIEALLQGVKLEKGDVLLVEVGYSDGHPPNGKQMQMFRKYVHEGLQKMDLGPTKVMALVVERGSVKLSKLSAERMDEAFERIEALEKGKFGD